jgi:hypothetical protein
MKRTWKFTMGTKREPCWSMYEGESHITAGSPKLVAYAKRARDGGWFVRISELNGDPSTERLYVDDDVFVPHFMHMMLEMHKNPKSKHF